MMAHPIGNKRKKEKGPAPVGPGRGITEDVSGRERLEVAENLLAKARSTPFGSERTIFAAGAFRQLARYLEAVDPAPEVSGLSGEPAPPPLCIDLRDRPVPGPREASEPAEAVYGAVAAGRRTVGGRVDLTL